MGLFGQSKKDIQAENEAMKYEIYRLRSLLSPEHAEADSLMQRVQELRSTCANIENNINYNVSVRNSLLSEIDRLNWEISDKKHQIISLTDDISLQEYGLYTPTFVFANSDLYKAELTKIRDAQKQCIKDGSACYGSNDWTVNGNAATGRAMVNDMKKLLLRAFNVECDDIVANVKISNLDKSVERIYKTSEQISKLGKIMSISISHRYIALKIDEVKLALDFQQKKQEEKDRLKELKEQQREAAKIQKEIEEERKKLAKEQAQYQNALSRIMEQISKDESNEDLIAKKIELENQLGEIGKAIEDVDYRSANQKAGYVYIISNVGSFGEGVYKIGMTRRLNPQERIDELGDASVPFEFDVHALIFSEDAPGLEAALHHAFEHKKVNKINSRREFFRVPLDEIKREVRKNFDKTVEWINFAEAEQFRQSLVLDNQ